MEQHEQQLTNALFDQGSEVLEQAADAALKRVCEGIRPAPIAYFEPRMRSSEGHFAVLAETYNSLFEQSGLSMNVFHHQSWQAPPSARWHGLFPVADHLAGAQRPADKHVLERFSHYLGSLLQRTLSASAAGIAVFPTARFLTLPGIAYAVANATQLRGAIIGVMESYPVPDCQDEALVKEAFAQAARSLSAPGKPILLLAESAAISSWLLECGFNQEQLLTAPFPAAQRFARERAPDNPGGPPRFGALGSTRPVHNPDALARYLLSADPGPVQWTVRLKVNEVSQQIGIDADELRRRLLSKGFHLLPAQMTQAAYDEALNALDVMLLPYGDRYETIGSGIFLECLCAGVIPLLPRHSTMYQLYKELGGAAPALDGTSPEHIAASVRQVTDTLEVLKGNARAVKTAWLNHDNGPKNWANRVNCLIGSLSLSDSAR